MKLLGSTELLLVHESKNSKIDGGDIAEVYVGSSYTLGSGASTGGSANLECTVLSKSGDRALCITKGVCGGAWPGISELTTIKSTYFGDLASAVSGVYLARGNADGSDMESVPTEAYVFNGTSFVNTHSTNVKTLLVTAATNYLTLGATVDRSWLGNRRNVNYSWGIKTDGTMDFDSPTRIEVICPTFILDLTKVKVVNGVIVTKGSSGGGTVDTTNCLQLADASYVVQDFNNVPQNRFMWFNNTNATNGPSGVTAGFLISFWFLKYLGGNYNVQIVLPINSNTVYFRQSTYGGRDVTSWTAWATLQGQ